MRCQRRRHDMIQRGTNCRRYGAPGASRPECTAPWQPPHRWWPPGSPAAACTPFVQQQTAGLKGAVRFSARARLSLTARRGVQTSASARRCHQAPPSGPPARRPAQTPTGASPAGAVTRRHPASPQPHAARCPRIAPAHRRISCSVLSSAGSSCSLIELSSSRLMPASSSP